MATEPDTGPDVLTQLARQMVGAMPELDADGRRIASSCYRLLADGRPVAVADIAGRAGIPEAKVQATLSDWPGVFTDDDGRLVGFWGLALGEIAHRFEVDGHTLYAWCAWDALFLPPILQRNAQVTSTCPTTGTDIRLTVDPDRGVVAVDPPTTVLSFLRPDRPFDEDVVASFCHYVHFFASPEAARDWTEDHPDTFVLDLDEGFRLGLAHPVHQPDRTLEVGPTRTGGGGGVDHDLLIIGGGSAAFAAAIRARTNGHTAAIIEAGTVGGTCVNVGCVPSKTLLRAAEIRHATTGHDFAGLITSAGDVDLAALVAQKDELVAAMRHDKYVDLVDTYGFEIIAGRARFVDPDTVEVDGRRLTAPAFLVATGASAAVPPINGLDDAGYLTSTTALELTEVPDRLAVIGANAIGLELGQLFARLGSQVTFLDVADRIAPFEEPEISVALTRVLTDEGATIHTSANVDRVTRDGEQRTVTATVDGQRIDVEADQVLVATGRRPNTGSLGLEVAGIDVDPRGAIITDDRLRTSNPKVWAAGDVTTQAQYVYVAAQHGTIAADNALDGARRHVDHRGLPRIIFTTPQVAVAGTTEAQAAADGIETITSVIDLANVPRAIVNRDTRGVIKLVADATDRRLLGASMLADGAADAIQTAVLAIRHATTIDELADTFAPYLTMVEGLKLAAQAFDRDVATLSCCAA